MSAAPLRVLVVDDHRLFRRGLRALLATHPEVEVVGEAPDGPAAVAAAGELEPDLVLLDLQMPGGDGLPALRGLLSAAPTTRVLVLTMAQDDDSVVAALRGGALGYVVKDADPDDLVRAIVAVGRGEAVLGAVVAARLAGLVARGPRAAHPFPGLTSSERDVLALVAGGASNQVIATSLHLSPKTVRNYVSSIFRKLGVADRAQAIVRAREAGVAGP